MGVFSLLIPWALLGVFLGIGGFLTLFALGPSSSHRRGFSRSRGVSSSLPFLAREVEGIIIFLVGFPFVLSAGNLLVGLRIDAAAIVGGGFLLLVVGGWLSTRSH
jgi:hypothetical protein